MADISVVTQDLKSLRDEWRALSETYDDLENELARIERQISKVIDAGHKVLSKAKLSEDEGDQIFDLWPDNWE